MRKLNLDVVNISGSTINAGKLVYITGYVQSLGLYTVDYASYDNSQRIPAMGILLEDIANNQVGRVKVAGPQEGIDTSLYPANTPVYLGLNGDITFISPAVLNPLNYVQEIGVVGFPSINGTIILQSSFSSGIESLNHPGSDAYVQGAGIPNAVTYWYNSSRITSSSNLYWDNTDGYLGVGTAFPRSTIYASKNIADDAYGIIHFINTNSSSSSASNAAITGSNIYATAQLKVDNTLGVRVGVKSYSLGSTGNLYLTSGNDTTAVTITPSGRVGIGTSLPGGLLGLGNSAVHINVDGGNNMVFTDPVAGSATLYSIVTAASGGLPPGALDGYVNSIGATVGYIPYFNTDPHKVMNSGLYWDNVNSRLGIGTTSPSQKLQVDGYIVPNIDNVYGLGNTSLRWGSVTVGPGSFHIVSSASETGGVGYDWRFGIDSVAGNLIFAQSTNSWLSLSNSGSLILTAAGSLAFNTKSIIKSSQDGYFTLQNNAGSNFAGLLFGGTTSSFPAIYVNGSSLEVRLANGSSYANLNAANLNILGTINSTGAITGASYSGGPISGTTGSFSGAVTGASYSGGAISGTTGSFTGLIATTAFGTAGAPAISIGTASNGFFAPATNQIAVTTNGLQVVVFDASQNSTFTGNIIVSSLGSAASPAISLGTTQQGFYKIDAHNFAVAGGNTTTVARFSDGTSNASNFSVLGTRNDSLNNAFYVQNLNNTKSLYFRNDGYAAIIGSLNVNDSISTNGPIISGSNIGLREQATDPLNIVGFGEVYTKTDHNLYYRDSTGTVTKINTNASGTVIGNGSLGQVSYWTSSNSISGGNNLFWDITNNRLGIGTTTPTETLQVDGYIVPNIDNVYGLGNSTFRWQSLTLGPDSLHITSLLSETGGIAHDWNVSIETASNQLQGSLYISDNGNRRLTFDAYGQLGIGASVTPNDTLTIDGNLSLQEQLGIPSTISGYGKLYTNSSDQNLYFKSSTGVISILSSAFSQAGNLIFATPNGSSGFPTFRSMVFADIPQGGAVTNNPFVWSGSNWGPNTDVLIGNATIFNLEPTPSLVRYVLNPIPRPLAGANESAGMYVRIDPVLGSTNQFAIYGEITSAQTDTTSGFMKIIQEGYGDAVYIASRGVGSVALESASYAWNTRGIISTLQLNQSGFGANNSDFTYATLFNGVWGFDGTGGSTVPPAYGMYYAARSLGNSFVTRKQDPLATGAAEGRIEWAIGEFNLLRNRVEVYNNGELRLLSLLSDSGTTVKDSPKISLRGSYWNGSSAVDSSVLFQNITPTATTGTNKLIVSVGDAGSETQIATLTSSQLTITGTTNTLGFVAAQSTKTGNYSLSPNDYTIFGDASGGNITITLPDAALSVNIGRLYNIKKKDATSNAVILNTTGLQTIDGVSSKSLTAQYSSLVVQSDGSNWFII